MARNYKGEYKNYHSKPKQKKRRAARNTARNRALKKGTVKKGDKKDIDHKDGNPRNNKKSVKLIDHFLVINEQVKNGDKHEETINNSNYRFCSYRMCSITNIFDCIST